MSRVYSSNRWFDFNVNRTTYKKRLVGWSIRIFGVYFEVGRLLPIETAPLTDEERAMLGDEG